MLLIPVRDVSTSSRRLRRSAGRRRAANNPPFSALPLDPLSSAAGIHQLFTQVRDALVVVDLDSGRILRWNPAAEDLFGYSTAEAVGRSVEMLMPPAVALLHRQRLAHYIKSGDVEVLTGRTPVGIPALTKRGDELRVDLSITPLEMPGTPTRSILLTFRDASCEKRVELKALELSRADAARSQIETKLRHCEQLLNATTRELAVPVANARRAVARLTRMANANGELSSQRLALLALVLEGRTFEVQRCLEQIADSAAIESGGFELHPQRVNLVPLVGRVVTTAKTRSNIHRLSLAAPQGLTAQCDAHRIEAVFHDLIDRSIRRNPRGCWIDVDLRRPLAGLAQIEVRDYGRRVSARERELLTNPVAADRGWFVNRYVVTQHGGTLTVEFPAEGGMRAIVSLPTHYPRRPS